MPSRFADLDVSVDQFIEQQENENTKRKTEQNLSLLNHFLSKNEKRSIEDIPSAELNLYLSKFIIKVRTNQNKNYEPNSLRRAHDSKLRKAFKEEELWFKYDERFTV